MCRGSSMRAVPALVALLAAPAATQEVLRSWVLELDAVHVDWLHDLDGDGLDELIVADPDFSAAFALSGVVRVCSTRAVAPGAGPVVLREHSGVRPFDTLGHYLVTLGDVDGRGGEDYAFEGRIHDGASGAQLVDLQTRFGLEFTFVEPLGDVDGDGDDEVLFRGADHVALLLGGDLTRKYDVRIPPERTLIEYRRLGDADGDGAPDFLVGSGYFYDHDYSGPLQIHSGRTGALLFTAEVDYEWSTFGGGSLALPGDWSADGVTDILQSGTLIDGRSGRILEPGLGLGSGQSAGDVDGDGVGDFFDGRTLLSGRTRAPLLVLPPREPGAPFRAGGRDWNGDGFPDLVRFQPSGGELAIWSGAPPGVRALGAPCGAGRASGPRIGMGSPPLLGREVELHLSGVGPGRDAWLLVGTELADAGPGCRARVVPASIFPARTAPVAPGIDVATIALTIPRDLALAGTRAFVQWIVSGSAAEPLAATRVLELTLGIPPDFPARVRGRVRTADGAPVAGARLQVLGQDAGGLSGSDGTFELEALPDARPLAVVADRPASRLSGWSEPFETTPGALVELAEIVLDEHPKQLVLGPAMQAANLEEVLAQELPAPRLLLAAAPPPDATPFELVWHVGGPLDEHARRALAGFVRAGGGLHLSGQRSTSVTAPLQLLLGELVLAGGVQVLPGGSGPYAFHPGARDRAALRPHVLAQWRAGAAGAGSVTGIADGNTLVVGASAPAGALWGGEELAGRRGRVTLLMGSAWMGLVGREEIADNLLRFLRRGMRAAAR